MRAKYAHEFVIGGRTQIEVEATLLQGSFSKNPDLKLDYKILNTI